METMQWFEISAAASSSQNSTGAINTIGGNDQRGVANSLPGALGAPTIKNHSVTYFNDHLYCFGGYDGQRNHNLLLLYNIKEHRWIRPQTRPQTIPESEFENSRNTPVESEPNISVARSREAEDDNDSNAIDAREANVETTNDTEDETDVAVGNDDSSKESALGQVNDSREAQNRQPRVNFENNAYNREIPSLNEPDALYPERDNRRARSNSNSMYEYTVTGNPPPGRNGHSATLATDEDENRGNEEGDVTGRIIVLGGWLGQGPLAASDMHVLEISRGGRALRWYQPPVKGTPPGPCNMHSADYVKARKEVFVFRGGNGREYLNDVHALHVPTMTWRKVETTGESPQQRANHSSCILEETGEIFIFGGWNGQTRLNDIHIFDTKTCNWSCPKVGGVLPHPRAGMTLTALRGRLYLFGGSGTSSKCFQDLQILDREQMAWLDVTQYESVPHGNSNRNAGKNHHHHNHHPLLPHPVYQRQHHYSMPEPSQLFFNTHSHQHQHYQHHHNHHHPYANYQDNGFAQSNPQWNMGRQGYHDYGNASHHQYHNPEDRSNRMNNPYMYNYDQHQNNNHTPMNQPIAGSFTSSRADWNSRELASQSRSMGTGVIASPNPNDEDSAPTVLLHGLRVPGSRAGHTATAVNRKIYVFGGSCGSDYLNDFYVLDTDPPPRATVTEATSSQLIGRRMYYFFNDEEFSDVTFMVQGRRVYGHKMVLALVSDCFRAMFTAGFRESSSSEIEIDGCTYEAFLSVMEYVYTGTEPTLADHSGQGGHSSLSKIVDIMELADRFFLDHLKQVCETQLQKKVRHDTVEYLLQIAQKTNAIQLQAICEHFIRNRDSERQLPL